MAGVQAMAADPALSLYVVGDSMRALVARLSDPAALPELPKLQARVTTALAHSLTAAFWGRICWFTRGTGTQLRSIGTSCAP